MRRQSSVKTSPSAAVGKERRGRMMISHLAHRLAQPQQGPGLLRTTERQVDNGQAMKSCSYFIRPSAQGPCSFLPRRALLRRLPSSSEACIHQPYQPFCSFLDSFDRSLLLDPPQIPSSLEKTHSRGQFHHRQT